MARIALSQNSTQDAEIDCWFANESRIGQGWKEAVAYAMGRAECGLVRFLVFDDDGNNIGATACAYDLTNCKVFRSVTTISTKYQRKGAGTQALKNKFLYMQMVYPGLKWFYTTISTQNIPSVKVCLKSGFDLMDIKTTGSSLVQLVFKKQL